LKIQGVLTVCDPKLVGEGNPNRCLYFDGEDVGKPKAERLCAKAQPDFSQLLLNPVNDVLESIVKDRAGCGESLLPSIAAGRAVPYKTSYLSKS